MPSSTVEIQAVDSNLPVEELFDRVSDLPFPVWLDSSSSEGARYHLISAAPEEQIRSTSSTAEAANQLFSEAERLLGQFSARNAMPGIPFQGGLIGYISYELGAAHLGIKDTNKPLIPSAIMGLYLWALVMDKVNHSRQLVFHPSCHPKTRQLVLERFSEANLNASSKRNGFALKKPFSASISQPSYAADFERINSYIHAGDVYQVNYAQHFSAPYAGDMLDAYLSLRKFAPAPYSGFLKIDNQAILCHSPEQFIEVKGRHVRTSPIKGTAPRSGDKRLDQRNAEVLLASEKDRAENLMIVDLMRNDLGKHCTTGSVQTSKLFELKSYSNVHHLVSEVVGELTPESSALELLATAIPAGSITGAPKKRSVEVIKELEPIQRSFYCGNLGYASLCGNMDFNIGIRSMVADGEEIHCWGGGGIVADSSVAKEYNETLYKVGGLMSELEKYFLQKTAPNQSSA